MSKRPHYQIQQVETGFWLYRLKRVEFVMEKRWEAGWIDDRNQGYCFYSLDDARRHRDHFLPKEEGPYQIFEVPEREWVSR